MIFSGFCGLKFCSVLATRVCTASIFKSACARAARPWYAVEALAVKPTRARNAFSALSRGVEGTLFSRRRRAMSAEGVLPAKFLKFSRTMYLKNAVRALLVRSRLLGIFKNFIGLEFNQSRNFRGFKFNAWPGGSALWSR